MSPVHNAFVPAALTSKSATRLVLVQALFQMEARQSSIDTMCAQFAKGWFTETNAEPPIAQVRFFRNVLEHVVAAQNEIDSVIDAALVDDWPLQRIDPTLRALFRAASGELMLSSTPPNVVINEFVDIAAAFAGTAGVREVGFVNGVLDRIAQSIDIKK